MLDWIEGDGVRVVLVEDATRFARSLMAQELGVVVMQQRGVQVICSNGDNLTQTDDPSRIMMRQVAGAFAEYEKSRLVQKLRHARDRKSAVVGRRIEGRKGYDLRNPEMVAEARHLRDRGMTQREIARALNESGFRRFRGTPIGSGQVCRMLGFIGVPVTPLPQSTIA